MYYCIIAFHCCHDDIGAIIFRSLWESPFFFPIKLEKDPRIPSPLLGLPTGVLGVDNELAMGGVPGLAPVGGWIDMAADFCKAVLLSCGSTGMMMQSGVLNVRSGSMQGNNYYTVTCNSTNAICTMLGEKLLRITALERYEW